MQKFKLVNGKITFRHIQKRFSACIEKSLEPFRGVFLPKILMAGFRDKFQNCPLQDHQVNNLRRLLEKVRPEVDRRFQREHPKESNGRRKPRGLGRVRWSCRRPKNAASHLRRRAALAAIPAINQLTNTNHCMRATSVTVLKEARFDDRLVCCLTGHNNA